VANPNFSGRMRSYESQTLMPLAVRSTTRMHCQAHHEKFQSLQQHDACCRRFPGYACARVPSSALSTFFDSLKHIHGVIEFATMKNLLRSIQLLLSRVHRAHLRGPPSVHQNTSATSHIHHARSGCTPRLP